MNKEFKVNLDSTEYSCLYLQDEDVFEFLTTGHKYYTAPKIDITFNPIYKNISLDIETSPRERAKDFEGASLIPELAKIRTLQIYDGKSVTILDFVDSRTQKYLLSDSTLVSLLKEFLQYKNLIAHNAIFDLSHLQRVFCIHSHNNKTTALNIECTMNMYRLLCSAKGTGNPFKANLKDVSKDVLDIEIEKETRDTDWSLSELTQEQLEYCAKDAILPFLLHQKLMPEILELGMKNIFDLNTAAQEAIAHMRIFGIGFDKRKHEDLTNKWQIETEIAYINCVTLLNEGNFEKYSKEELQSLLIDKVLKKQKERIFEGFKDLENTYKSILKLKINLEIQYLENESNIGYRQAINRVLKNIDALIIKPTSTKQKSDWFKDNLDDEELFSWGSSEKTDNLKVDKNTLAEKDHLPIAKALNDYNKVAKLYSTYGIGFKKHIVAQDDCNFIYPNFTLCFTGTGRTSSFAPNVQTMPRQRELRELFIPRAEDRKLLVADYSQIELRVGALISKDKCMLDAYETGKDLHRITAANFARKPYDDVTKDERQLAKAINFGLAFGAGVDTLKKYSKLQYKVELQNEEALEAVNTYRNTYPEYREWQLKQTAQAKETLTVRTPLGKLRTLKEDSYYCASLNTPVQGGAGEIMLMALCMLWIYIQNTDVDAYIVNVVHDEIIVDCHNKDVEEMKLAIKDCMERGMKAIFPNATLNGLVEVGVGENWYEAK